MEETQFFGEGFFLQNKPGDYSDQKKARGGCKVGGGVYLESTKKVLTPLWLGKGATW